MVKSMALTFVKQDKAAIKPVVARTTTTNLAVRPSIKLQIMTGVRRRIVTRGTRKTRTALVISNGGKIYISDSRALLDLGGLTLANHALK